MASKCGRNKKVAHEPLGEFVRLMFLTRFDFICDLVLKRRTATRNLFVLYNKEKKSWPWWRHLCVCPLIDHGQEPIKTRVEFSILLYKNHFTTAASPITICVRPFYYFFLVLVLQKGQGPPGREPVFNEEQRKQMMTYAYRKQEELKVSANLNWTEKDMSRCLTKTQ